jgi:hypothetical protein
LLDIFYGLSDIVAYSLNQIIKLPSLIESSQVSDLSIEFFLLL